MPSLKSKQAPLVLLVVLLLVAYARVATCDFIWDDDDYVTNNPVLRTSGGLWDIWFVPTSLPQYYPLVHTTFWLEYRVWELHPLGYHLVNVALHGASALVLLRLGRRLAVPGVLLGALWFAVHPVHVESVAWVTERKNVLSLLCYLLAAERWLRWHDGDGPGARSYLIGSLWFVGALWSKTVTASLPAALLIVIWWRDGALTKRAFLAAAPWLVVGATLALVGVGRVAIYSAKLATLTAQGLPTTTLLTQQRIARICGFASMLDHYSTTTTTRRLELLPVGASYGRTCSLLV